MKFYFTYHNEELKNNLSLKTVNNINLCNYIVYSKILIGYDVKKFKNIIKKIISNPINLNFFLKNRQNINNNIIKILIQEKIDNICNKYNKNIIIFLENDYNDNLKYNNDIILFRTSLKKSKRTKNEYLLPASYKINSNFNFILPKSEMPKIGFCGYLGSSKYRLQICNLLKKKKSFNLNFIYRKKWGGNEIDKKISFKEYIENIDNNHFNICFNGSGNFSFRFYEVLSRGRIPILLDTDNILPFDNKINYNNHIVISRKIEEIPNKILNFYNINNIEEVQKNNFILFEKYFNRKNLFKHLFEQLLVI